VKTVIHWTTELLACPSTGHMLLTGSDPSEKEDRRPNITIDSAPLHDTTGGLTPARSL
jgi:hypothetical protein